MCNKRAMVAMSGGVDSSVATYLMKQQGFDTCGITLKLFDNEDISVERDKTCCSLTDVEDARSVAFKLDIPYYVFNFSDNFKKEVIDRFIDTYRRGGTPNPCIDCNRYIKFNQLMLRARELDYDYVVTGHYAVIEKSDNRYLLKKAVDSTKDQSYVLYSLTQDQLKKTMFPLGALTKAEVRKIADKLGFVNADKPDSQDICFVPDGNYAKFIEEYTDSPSETGSFLDIEGKKLGTHKGIIHYTIGQRKGLGLSMDKPVYVCRKDVCENTVTVGEEKHLYSKTLTACDINLISCDKIDGSLHIKARTRYKQKEAPATIVQLDENRIHVEFDTPQRAVTSGQAVVFYDGDVVVGGGTIE